MKLTRATREAIKYACLKFHYAKSVPVNTFGYNVYNDHGEWCGVILYGSGASKDAGKQFGLIQGSILELVRVALNGKQECTSQAVAMSLKRLKKDCPLCRLVVSYADCDQRHLGTIYQATNWIFVGTMLENSTDSSWMIHGKRYHGRTISDMVRRKGGLNGLTREQFFRRYYDPNAYQYTTKGKRKYLMPLDKQIRKTIEPMRRPYPKDDVNWTKIDRTRFKKT